MKHADKKNLLKLIDNTRYCDLVRECKRIVEAIECEPEPVEFWFNLYEDGSLGGEYKTKEEAFNNKNSFPSRRILMREVTDEN